MTQKLVLTPLIEKFCNNVDHIPTRTQYGKRLHDFDSFLQLKYKVDIDQFVESFKDDPVQFDVYEVLSQYRISLRAKIQKATMATRIMTARHFLELNDVPINSTKWRMKVKPPKADPPEKTALSKDNVRKIILGCQSMRLHTFVHTTAAAGWRANEGLSVLTKHVNLENGTIYLRKEHTKMKRARTVLLTKECVNQLKLWKDYRNRVRRFVTTENGKRKITFKTVPLTPDSLFFSTGRHDEIYASPHDLYKVISREFAAVLDRIGFAERREDGRHKITLHSFRTFVKSTISGLGYQDFSEYFIGHKHSTYWGKTPVEILELFHKVEPDLTYLEYSKLEAHGADVDTKLDQKDKEIQALKEQMATLTTALYNAGILKKD